MMEMKGEGREGGEGEEEDRRGGRTDGGKNK